MCKTFGKAVMPTRIFENVHVRNLAGNELQAEPGGVAGSGRARLRCSPTCKKQSAGLCKHQPDTPMYLRPIRMTGASVPMHRCRCAEVCGLLKKHPERFYSCSKHMCNTFGKVVMPARIFEKVHVRN